MLTFLVRRLVGAVLVLIAVSFITYLIFVKFRAATPPRASPAGPRPRRTSRTSAKSCT